MKKEPPEAVLFLLLTVRPPGGFLFCLRRVTFFPCRKKVTKERHLRKGGFRFPPFLKNLFPLKRPKGEGLRPLPFGNPTRGRAIIKSRLCREAAKVGGGRWPPLVCAYITGCRPLALPLGELSPQVTERAGMVMVCPLRPRCARPPLPKGEARAAHTVHQNVCRGGASAVERSGTSTLGVPRPLSQSLRHGLWPRHLPLHKGGFGSSAPAGAGRGLPRPVCTPRVLASRRGLVSQ